jgi:hypothetical protein
MCIRVRDFAKIRGVNKNNNNNKTVGKKSLITGDTNF